MEASPTTKRKGTRRLSPPRPARRLSGPDRPGQPRREPDDLVVTLVRDHSASMLSVARRFSFCADDANDAWQRSVEILLRRASSLDPATAPAWLRTVVKHEALAVRAERARSVAGGEVEPDNLPASVDMDAAGERFERIAAAAEALERLKPHEAEALMMFASGLSYREICEAKGWTYTKVNRLITEGRKAFRSRVDGIEKGQECARWQVTLNRMVESRAGRKEIEEIRPHLRRCRGCRSVLAGRRGRLAGIAPLLPGLALPGVGIGRGSLPNVRTWLSDTLLGLGVRAQALTDAAAGSKAVAVAASAAAIAGGSIAAHGQVVHHSARDVPAVTGQAATPSPAQSEATGRSLPPVDGPAARTGSLARADAPASTSRPSPGEAAAAEFDPIAGRSPSQPSGSSAGSPVASSKGEEVEHSHVARLATPDPSRTQTDSTAEFGP